MLLYIGHKPNSVFQCSFQYSMSRSQSNGLLLLKIKGKMRRRQWGKDGKPEVSQYLNELDLPIFYSRSKFHLNPQIMEKVSVFFHINLIYWLTLGLNHCFRTSACDLLVSFSGGHTIMAVGAWAHRGWWRELHVIKCSAHRLTPPVCFLGPA